MYIAKFTQSESNNVVPCQPRICIYLIRVYDGVNIPHFKLICGWSCFLIEIHSKGPLYKTLRLAKSDLTFGSLGSYIRRYPCTVSYMNLHICRFCKSLNFKTRDLANSGDDDSLYEALFITRIAFYLPGAEGTGREILQRPPPSIHPSVRLSVRPSRLVFTL